MVPEDIRPRERRLALWADNLVVTVLDDGDSGLLLLPRSAAHCARGAGVEARAGTGRRRALLPAGRGFLKRPRQEPPQGVPVQPLGVLADLKPLNAVLQQVHDRRRAGLAVLGT